MIGGTLYAPFLKGTMQIKNKRKHTGRDYSTGYET